MGKALQQNLGISKVTIRMKRRFCQGRMGGILNVRGLFVALALVVMMAAHMVAPIMGQAATLVDIHGPGQSVVNLAIASPLTGPSRAASSIGVELDKAIQENLSFLPFMRLTVPAAVLGGTVLTDWQGAGLDFRRFQIAGADLLVTAFWPNGDGNNSLVELRVFETNSGKFVFGNAYKGVNRNNVPDVADQFCADLMQALTGNGDFFRSTLAFARTSGPKKRDIWLSKPTGKDLRQITNIAGTAMSPAWSPDGRYVVFSHLDDSTHALGVWDRLSNKVTRIRFPGNTVIGPAFMPDNKVAVSLSTGKYPDIFLLNHKFERERGLEESQAINVSPTFDSTGTKMAFTSSRLGGPQIFLKDLRTGAVNRVSMNGNYNTEPSISPDGTLVAFTRLTDAGHRIFVQDMVTGQERQVSFGPGRDEQPSFAPDSYFVAFTSDRAGQKRVYLTTRHGGDPKMVPTGPGEATFPRWGKIPPTPQN